LRTRLHIAQLVKVKDTSAKRNEENYTAKFAKDFQADLKVCLEGDSEYSFCSPSHLPSSYSAGDADISAHKSPKQLARLVNLG
ncbi:UNVERIFIED_CONTAM: hypothetical protein Sindi_0949000, partial [Sesamum indicum]